MKKTKFLIFILFKNMENFDSDPFTLKGHYDQLFRFKKYL